jgi:serine/threonine protein kinase
MGNHASAGANPLTLEDFDVVTKVGRGAFGKVWHVVKRDSGQSFAMKVLKKKDVIEQDLIDHTALEIEIMGSFGDHPFVVNLYYAFQDDFKVSMSGA